MHASYRINLVRGEDRRFPVTLVYRNPETGENEAADITGARFLLTVRSEPEDEVLAQLSTENAGIVLGNMVDREFVAVDDGETATSFQINFTHDVTEDLVGRRMYYDLFLIRGNGPDEYRHCLMAGEVKAMRSPSYG